MENTEDTEKSTSANLSYNHTLKAIQKIKKFELTSDRFSYKEMGNSAEETSNEGKLKQRSNLKLEEWEKYGYYKDDWCEKMLNNLPETELKVDIEEYDLLSEQDFIEKYERLGIPLIIKGGTKNWDGLKLWNFQNLYKRFKESKVKVGEDDEGYKIKMRFKYFLEYLIFNKDDSPLYLFESSVENNGDLKEIINEYEVPKYFKEDLFSLIDEERRPPFRWFLVGPERSGTDIHRDPLGTSAWNSSVYGHKLWLLLPPNTPKHIAKGKEVLYKGEDDEAIMYMKFIFPRIKEKYGDLIKEMMFIQNPGDTVFIPGGWWHVVVNLDDTIAVTQNYCNSVNFSQVWLHVRSERKKMAVIFLNQLKKYKKEMYNVAIELNKRDNFEMYSKEQMLSRKRTKGEGVKKILSSAKKEDSDSSSDSSSSSLHSADFD